MKPGYKKCMGWYKDGICNRCNMLVRGYGLRPRKGNKGYCYREIPKNKIDWIDINARTPYKGQYVLVKSNRYGIGYNIYSYSDKFGYYFNNPQAKYPQYRYYDDTVIQWSENLLNNSSNNKKESK